MIKEKTNRRIAEIKDEIRKTPYHKGTEHHIGLLRAKLSKLRGDLRRQEEASAGGGGVGFMVKKTGHATCLILGPPSCGKSSLVNALTNAGSKVGGYDFTTVKLVPGMMEYRGALIQLLDAPGIIKSGFAGRGGGRQILSAARAADLVLIMSDVERPGWLGETVKQLNAIGIRLNKKKPAVDVRPRNRGGIGVVGNWRGVGKEMVEKVARELGVKNGLISIGESFLDMETLLDGLAGDRIFLPAVFAVNKVDGLKETESVLRQVEGRFVPLNLISVKNGWGLKRLKLNCWKQLELARVFLKKDKNMPADKKPLIIKNNLTIKKMAERISADFNPVGALVWGKKAKFPGQRVSLNYEIADGDKVFLIKN